MNIHYLHENINKILPILHTIFFLYTQLILEYYAYTLI